MQDASDDWMQVQDMVLRQDARDEMQAASMGTKEP